MHTFLSTKKKYKIQKTHKLMFLYIVDVSILKKCLLFINQDTVF